MVVSSFAEWLEWAKPIWNGPLNLSTHEFEEMQVHEFNDKWDGYIWRKEQEENQLAYFTAAMMSVHTSRPVSPKYLINPLRNPVKTRSKTDNEAHLKKVFNL